MADCFQGLENQESIVEKGIYVYIYIYFWMIIFWHKYSIWLYSDIDIQFDYM